MCSFSQFQALPADLGQDASAVSAQLAGVEAREQGRRFCRTLSALAPTKVVRLCWHAWGRTEHRMIASA